MINNIKIEKVNDTIVVSTMNYRRNMFVDMAQYHLDNKQGSIYTETINKKIKNLKTWKTKVEEILGEKVQFNI